MAHIVDGTSWYTRIAELSVLPAEVYYAVRMIKWLSISLALALILPVFALVVYDILLWFWRLVTLAPSINVQPGDIIKTDPAIPGTSKSEIRASELEKVRDTDKPASD